MASHLYENTISIFQKSESDSSSISQPVGQINLDLNNNENTDSTEETNEVSWHTLVMVYKPNGNGNNVIQEFSLAHVVVYFITTTSGCI